MMGHRTDTTPDDNALTRSDTTGYGPVALRHILPSDAAVLVLTGTPLPGILEDNFFIFVGRCCVFSWLVLAWRCVGLSLIVGGCDGWSDFGRGRCAGAWCAGGE